jgi:hypothetical protein
MLKIAVKRRPVVGQGGRGATPQELKPGADAVRWIVSTVSVDGLHAPDPRWIPLIHFNRMVVVPVGGVGGMMLFAKSTSKGFSLV